jgi:UDP-N-acetylglucosamine diphosphorylase/glucosamine-1-phosphate N-acetyltransferase
LHVVLLEHDEAELLYPFALTHGAWELRAGYYTIAERWAAALPSCRVHVHSHRTNVLEAFLSVSQDLHAYEGGSTLLVLANLVLSPASMRAMVGICRSSASAVHFMVGGQTVGVFVPNHQGSLEDIPTTVDEISGDAIDSVHVDGHLINRLWQILDRIPEAVAWDAELLGQTVNSSARVHPTSVIDESAGPVIIGPQAEVGPLCVVQGPAVLGDHTILKPHSHIKETVTGPHCRISGEISGTVFQGFSNKQHAGFVGNSYIGSWVNLGAGTTTSNLKNTYSNVKPRLPWGREDSQRMFLGSLIGDYTRTAIGTLLPTGGVYGACVAIFQTSPAYSSNRSFMWDDQRYELDKAIETIGKVMSRRNQTLTEPQLRLLTDICDQDAAA